MEKKVSWIRSKTWLLQNITIKHKVIYKWGVNNLRYTEHNLTHFFFILPTLWYKLYRLHKSQNIKHTVMSWCNRWVRTEILQHSSGLFIVKDRSEHFALTELFVLIINFFPSFLVLWFYFLYLIYNSPHIKQVSFDIDFCLDVSEFLPPSLFFLKRAMTNIIKICKNISHQI